MYFETGMQDKYRDDVEDQPRKKLDKGKGKMKVTPELPEDIWRRVFELYYDDVCESWNSTGLMTKGITPLLISQSLYPVASAVLYTHPHLSENSIGRFIDAVGDRSAPAAKAKHVRHLTVRPTISKLPDKAPGSLFGSRYINPSLPVLTRLVPELSSFTLKDCLIDNPQDAFTVFSALSAIVPKKARLEIRMCAPPELVNNIATTRNFGPSAGYNPASRLGTGSSTVSPFTRRSRRNPFPSFPLRPSSKSDTISGPAQLVASPSAAAHIPTASNVNTNTVASPSVAPDTDETSSATPDPMATLGGTPEISAQDMARAIAFCRTVFETEFRQPSDPLTLATTAQIARELRRLGSGVVSIGRKEAINLYLNLGYDWKHHWTEAMMTRFRDEASRTHTGITGSSSTASPLVPDDGRSEGRRRDTLDNANGGTRTSPVDPISLVDLMTFSDSEDDDAEDALFQEAIRQSREINLPTKTGQASSSTSSGTNRDPVSSVIVTNTTPLAPTTDYTMTALPDEEPIASETAPSAHDTNTVPTGVFIRMRKPIPKPSVSKGGNGKDFEIIRPDDQATSSTQTEASTGISLAASNETETSATPGFIMTATPRRDSSRLRPDVASVDSISLSPDTLADAESQSFPFANEDSLPSPTWRNTRPVPPEPQDSPLLPHVDEDWLASQTPANLDALKDVDSINIETLLTLLVSLRLLGPAHIQIQLLGLITKVWSPRLQAFSLVALDSSAAAIAQSPELDFWIRVPIPHIRVHLPPNINALVIFKGAAEHVRDRLEQRARADEEQARENSRRSAEPETDTDDRSTAMRERYPQRTPERQIVGGDGAGGGLLHPENKLFEIEVNTMAEMTDKMWDRAGSQLPAQVCRIMVGEHDWSEIVPGRTGEIRPDNSDAGFPSPKTDDYASPLCSEYMSDSDDEGIEDFEIDSDGSPGVGYDAEAAKAQAERIASRKRDRAALEREKEQDE